MDDHKVNVMLATGITCTILSFIHWFLPYTLINLAFATFVFMLGNILFFDSIVYKSTQKSILHSYDKDSSRIFYALVCYIVFVLFLELYVHWLGKFWYFPKMSTAFYIFVEVPLLLFYSLYLLESYQAVKILFRDKVNNKLQLNKNVHIAHSFSSFAVEVVILLTATLYLFSQRLNDSFNEFFSISTVVIVSHPILHIITISLVFLTTISIVERLLYKLKSRSYLLCGDYSSILSMCLAGLISGLFYEVFNAFGGFWRYSNVPFSEVNLFQIPILVLVCWPVQYFILIPLYDLLVSEK